MALLELNKEILIKSSGNDPSVEDGEEPADVGEVDQTEVVWA